MSRLVSRVTGVVTILLLTSALVSVAQTPEPCATMDFLKEQIKSFPEYADSLAKSEEQIQNWIQENGKRTEKMIYKIPVVVHVVYNANHPEQNIPDWQIQSQIDVLNEDFRRINSDSSQTPSVFKPIAADCEIEFCLAKRDPLNRPSNGITRTATTADVFSNYNAVKSSATGGSDAWTKNKYLNIWVCNMEPPRIGIATFPRSTDASLDGIVVHYAVFGRYLNSTPSYNLGRTCTHEVGHWLDLHHIWGDNQNGCYDSDYVNDTPNQDSAVYGCITFPAHKSCGNDGDMTMNYMNYAYDRCMNLFTQGQKQRMHAALITQRGAILNSDACNPVLNYPVDVGISQIYFPESNVSFSQINPVIRVSNYGTETVSDFYIHFQYYRPDMIFTPVHWTGNLPSGESVNITLPKVPVLNSSVIFVAYIKSPNGVQDMDTTNNFLSFRRAITNSLPVELNSDKPINIYPNPSFGSVTIEMDSLNQSPVSVQLYNLLGQEERVSLTILPDNKLIVETGILPQGVYILHIKNGSKWFREKILKINMQ